MSTSTIAPVATMEASDYWKHCAQEWHNVALGAHEAGAPEVEEFYEELSESADFMGYQLGYDWTHGK